LVQRHVRGSSISQDCDSDAIHQGITNLRVRNLWADRQDVDRFLSLVWILQFLASIAMLVHNIVKNAGEGHP
jgi:hypothetical protein